MSQNNYPSVFCMKCFKNRAFVIKNEEKTTEYDGQIVHYTKKSTYCAKCGEPIYVQEVALENLAAIKSQLK